MGEGQFPVRWLGGHPGPGPVGGADYRGNGQLDAGRLPQGLPGLPGEDPHPPDHGPGHPAFQTALQGAIQAMPKLNYIVDQIDGMVPATVAALRLEGRSKGVGIATYNGTPAILGNIQSKNFVTMDVGESAPWIAYSSMDQAFRLLAGKPTVQDDNPVRIWSGGNISQAGNPPSLVQGYGSAFESGFLKLWGLS